jgi:uncharacterized protein (TIGR03083 family)
MEIAEHITAVAQEAKLFAEAAKRSDLDVEVPTCPGWVMRDLVRHLSEIHLWAAARVAKRASKIWQEDISESTEAWPDLAVFWPDDDDLVDWYLETNANLVRSLESASPSDEMFTFLPAPSPLAMWARRQAHETAVHRFDAEYATGHRGRFDPVFASDGIDELVVSFAQRRTKFPVDSPRTMTVHAQDTDDYWHITMSPDGIVTVREKAQADVTLSGTASDLYLVLWNRPDDSTISVVGDEELLALWHGNCRIRWED